MPRNYPVGPSGAVGTSTRKTTRCLDRRNLSGYGSAGSAVASCQVVGASAKSSASGAGFASGVCSATGASVGSVPSAFAAASCVVSGLPNALYRAAAFAASSATISAVAVATTPGQAVALSRASVTVSGATSSADSGAGSITAIASGSMVGAAVTKVAVLVQAAITMDGDTGNATWLQTIFASSASPGSSSITVSAGSAVLVHMLDYSGSGKTLTVTEGSTSYTLVAPPGQSSDVLSFDTVATCYLLNLSAGAHTITVKGTAGDTLYYALSEYKGLITFDTSAGQWQHLPGSGTNAITSGSLSPATGELLIGACWTGTNGASIPGSSNGTIRASHDYGAVSLAIADIIAPGGSTAMTFTDSNGLLHNYQTSAIAFAGN